MVRSSTPRKRDAMYPLLVVVREDSNGHSGGDMGAVLSGAWPHQMAINEGNADTAVRVRGGLVILGGDKRLPN